MIRRPLLPAAALVATLTLAACNSSPEAGRPDTTPTTATSSPSPTADPTYTPEEQAAITAAKARYIAARAAVDKAFEDPAQFNRNALEKAGNGGQWMIELAGGAQQLQDYGWYRSGTSKISATRIISVKLDLEQPEVRLTNCIDSSGVVTRFKKDDKPVPMGPGNGKRHKFSSQLVYAAPSGSNSKIWFLIADKAAGPC